MTLGMAQILIVVHVENNSISLFSITVIFHPPGLMEPSMEKVDIMKKGSELLKF